MGKTVSVAARLRWMAAGVTLMTLGLAAWTGFAFYQSTLEQRLATTRNVVQQSVGIAQKYADAAHAGQMTEDAARQKAMAEIKALRYDGKEYVWINDMQPRMVMHPIKPEMDGKDLSEFKDAAGGKLFIAMTDLVKRQGSGFYDYV